ncbi:OmpA family protein [Beggiatoa alba]|nr:OmpA family protein [Beggiatoa alba]
MKSFSKLSNTLSVPIATKLSLTLLLASATPALAGIQHYQAPLDSVRWVASSQKLHCSLTHDIPFYGQATFAQSAGEKLGFTLKVKHKASRNKDIAHLRSIPPEWKHQISIVDLGEVPVLKGERPFQLKQDLSRRLLAELRKGMSPTFSYRDWADARDQVSVALPGIHIKQALDEFIGCLSSLPIYKFTDFKINLLHFATGKHGLKAKDRKRLDDVARYLKSDPAIKRIEIYGHTDNIGRKRNNDKLGKRRSAAVKQYLVSKGVSASKFKLKSHGERKPKASNRSDKGRAINRRVLVTLIK